MFSRYRYIEGFTPLLGSEGSFTINYLGEIKDCYGTLVPTSGYDDGHPTINVCGWRGKGRYKRIELVMFQFKDIHVPVNHWRRIEPFVIDGNKENVQARNVGYRFKNGPIESKDFPGFYYIPAFTRYVINREGKMIRADTGHRVAGFTMKGNPKKNIQGGYICSIIIHPTGKRGNILRHRALALTFLPYPNNADSLVVNHLNGVPGSDALENLEWCTHAQNNIHALANGLKNQNICITVKNVFSGEIKRFVSLSTCGGELNLSQTTVHKRATTNFGSVYEGGYQFKLDSDKREFPNVKNPEQAIKDSIQAISVKARNCLTLAETVYPSIQLCANAVGVNNVTIAYRLKKDDRSPLRGFQFALMEDPRPFPEFSTEDYQKTLEPSAMPVDAKNLFTGDVVTFPSVAVASGTFGGILAETLRRGDQYLTETGWLLKYATEEFMDVTDPESACYAKRQIVAAKSEKTGKIYVTNSAKAMANFLGLDPKKLRKTALTRGKTVYNGYRFKLGLDEPWPY